MTKRARLSVEEVVLALDEELDEYQDEELEESDNDEDEPMMEGSDEEFGELSNEVREQIEGEEEESDESNQATSADGREESDESNQATSADGRSDLPLEWTEDLTDVEIPSFSSYVGPNVSVPNNSLGDFELFFTTDLLENITAQSNLYAIQVLGDSTLYKPMTVEELKAYLGFCILMAVNYLPEVEDYWKKDNIYHYTPIASRITRERFRELSRYLHFVDNTILPPREDPSYDRLQKIRPFIQHCSERFQAVYSPHKEVAVDEAMIKFQGRSSLKQYMPLKPIKRGIKVWVLADSHNGYFCKFDVYTGKTGDTIERGLPARVVKSLTTDLKGKNHHVFYDNFFNSFDLLNHLALDNIFACGTARSNRKGYPEVLKNVKLAKR